MQLKSKLGRSGSDIYTADFETCDYDNGVRVWSWAVAHGGEAVGWGQSIRGFMAFLSEHAGTYYFHNLKFDGAFIVSYLLGAGWCWVDGRPADSDTFSSLIGDDGSWYTLTIRFPKHIVEIRDSLKKIPLPVRAMPKAFGFEEDEAKGTIDYTAIREPGYLPTDEEWEYVKADVRIVDKALAQLYSNGLTKLTQSSDTMAEYKGTLGGEDAFRKLFPVIDQESDHYLRCAYRGGITMADPRFAGRVHEVDGVVVDANSMYPSVMRQELLPYGSPEWTDDMPDDGLWIGRVYLDIDVKPDHVACWSEMRTVRFGNAAEYASHLEGEFTLTNVDLDLIKEHYTINEFVFVDAYTFKSARGMFDKHIDHWYAVKAQSSGGQRWIAKMMLNTLYGKFGVRPQAATKRPYLDDDGVICFERSPEEDRPVMYIPMAVFVTAYARSRLMHAAQANYSTFAYCDTDSVHLLGSEVRGVEVHESKLGAWKVEGHFSKAIYRRAKCYAETLDGVFVAHIAGVPENLREQVTYGDLLHGGELHGKLVPRQVPGGVRLVETTFTIK